MKNRFLSLLLLICVIFGMFTGCDNPTQSSELVDYAGQAVLDLDGTDTIKQEVTVKQYIDGDTTHFNYPSGANVPEEAKEIGYLKARYIAVNTPESTGTIEAWGKAASNYTKEKLKSANSIILETEGTKWEADSTKDRFLVWVWYKVAGSDVYRNLNLELLQEGLAWASKSGVSRYGSLCTPAIAQAKAHKLHVYSEENDPDYYYGSAIELDLKELRTNIANYNGMRVAFEATVVQYYDWNAYVEDYDEESDMYYGISVFYGYKQEFHDFLAIRGNRVRIVGNVSYYEAGGTYQVSSLRYDVMDPTNAENVQLLETGLKPAYAETSLETFLGNKTVNITDGDDAIPQTFQYAQLAMNTSIQMNGLQVVDVYTTRKGGSNDGAISLTCKADGKTITVRTTVLKDNLNLVPDEYKDANNVVLESYFEGKTIDVKGIVDYFDGEYQIKVFSVSAFTFHP